MLEPKEWPEDGNNVILPSPGQPRKARRREPDEPTVPYKISRSCYVVKCGNCGNEGHMHVLFLTLRTLVRKFGKKKDEEGSRGWGSRSCH